jgi:hypothetical protein
MTATADLSPETAFGMLFGSGKPGLDALSDRLGPRVMEETHHTLKSLAEPVRDLVLRQLIEETRDFLGVVLGSVLRRGWCSYELVRDAIRETAQTPNMTREVALEEHEIAADYSCVLAVELGGLPEPLHEIPLKLSVTVRLRGAVVEVVGGRLKTAQMLGPGDIRVAATAYERPVAQAIRVLDPLWVQEFGPGLDLPSGDRPTSAPVPVNLP